MVVKIKQSEAKPLVIEYGEEGQEKEYTLPGHQPTELITAADSVPRPKVMAGAQKKDYEGQVNVAVLSAFLNHVVPDDFRAKLDTRDVGAVFEAWQEHTGWGKDDSSES